MKLTEKHARKKDISQKTQRTRELDDREEITMINVAEAKQNNKLSVSVAGEANNDRRLQPLSLLH